VIACASAKVDKLSCAIFLTESELMKKLTIFAIFIFYSYSALGEIIPQSGFWHVNGWQGMGFSIEVQGESIYVVTYAYDEAGNPLFYTSAGTIDSSNNTFRSTLDTWRNGYCFTCGYRAAEDQGSEGEISITFITDSTAILSWPGGIIDIQRYKFASTEASSDLSGTWQLTAFSNIYPGCSATGDIVLRQDDVFLNGTASIAGNCMGGPSKGTVTGVADGNNIELRFAFPSPGAKVEYIGFEGYYQPYGDSYDIGGRWFEWSYEDYGNATLSR
jgi:hypothetical protein